MEKSRWSCMICEETKPERRNHTGVVRRNHTGVKSHGCDFSSLELFSRRACRSSRGTSPARPGLLLCELGAYTTVEARFGPWLEPYSVRKEETKSERRNDTQREPRGEDDGGSRLNPFKSFPVRPPAVRCLVSHLGQRSSHTKCVQNSFPEVNSPTNPTTYPVLLLICRMS